MKKIISIIICSVLIFGCSKRVNADDTDEKYRNLYQTLIMHDDSLFVNNTDLFDISFEGSMTNKGYRYYVVLDNPRYAMYGVSIIALAVGEDYSDLMAPNAGIFENVSYKLVPGQTNSEDGYVKGINISGICDNQESVKLKVLVQWHSNRQEVKQEFFYHDFSLDE